jgi:hypothetical protein
MAPTVGRTVLYKLHSGDVEQITQHRRKVEDAARNAAKSAGADDVVHPISGNLVIEGEQYPAVVVRTFGGTTVNLQVSLDGNDTYWVASRSEGDGPGFWSWPPRA